MVVGQQVEAEIFAPVMIAVPDCAPGSGSAVAVLVVKSAQFHSPGLLTRLEMVVSQVSTSEGAQKHDSVWDCAVVV